MMVLTQKGIIKGFYKKTETRYNRETLGVS